VVLQLEAEFQYTLGCATIIFRNPLDMHVVQTEERLDMAKLQDCYLVCKEVVHARIGIEEAIARLDEIANRKPLRSPWVLVFIYGVASATAGPFGFQAGPVDIPVLFLLGCIVGFLQLTLAPRFGRYCKFTEIFAAIITSFLARMFGSINGGNVTNRS